MTDSVRLGVHVSIAGSLERSVDRGLELGCNTFQIFSRNPRSWARTPLRADVGEAFISARRKTDIKPVVVHSSYLVNLASSDDSIVSKSIESLKEDMERACLLGVEYVVTHIGSARGLTLSQGLKRVILALGDVLSKYRPGGPILLLENTAGHGDLVGGKVEEVGSIISELGDDRIGFCLDTCHAFARGYELRSDSALDFLEEKVEREIGLDRLRLIHLNDSKGDIGMHRDRHEDIGAGYIGLEGFRRMLRHSLFRGRPWILETPRESDEDDRRNLAVVRGIVAGV